MLTPIWALLLACSQPAPRPNLLLITLDTTRADHVLTAGTPNLSALAARGVHFERALSPVPITLPAHTTLMTGLEPWEHGVHNNSTYTAGPELQTLAETLSSEGWRTAAVIAATPLSSARGLDQGFEFYEEGGLRKEAGTHAPERSAEQVTATALAILEGLPEPWFLWVHYFDPHSPWQTPVQGDETPYQAEIRAMDASLGALLAAVDAEDLVLLTADHGEALGEHGEPTHGYFLHDATLRVPLMLAGPGVPVGQTVGGTARLSDLHATALHLLGLREEPALATWEAVDRPAYGETWMPTEALGLDPVFSWTEHGLRLIESPTSRLYELATDPLELHPVEGREEERQALSAHLTDKPRPTPRSGSGEVDPALVAMGYLDAPDLGEGEVYDNTALIQGALALYSGTETSPEELLALLAAYPTAPEVQQIGLALLVGTEHYGPALERAAEALPSDGNVQARAALHWAQGGDPRALGALETAIAVPRQGVSTGIAAWAALELGREDLAGPLVDELVRQPLVSADTLYDRARLRHARGDLRGAIGDYTAVARLEPDNAEVWRNLAYAQAMTGRTSDAIENLEKSLALQPDAVAQERLEQLRAP